jgi:hypothetical protein
VLNILSSVWRVKAKNATPVARAQNRSPIGREGSFCGLSLDICKDKGKSGIVIVIIVKESSGFRACCLPLQGSHNTRFAAIRPATLRTETLSVAKEALRICLFVCVSSCTNGRPVVPVRRARRLVPVGEEGAACDGRHIRNARWRKSGVLRVKRQRSESLR